MEAPRVAAKFDGLINWERFDFLDYARSHYMNVCFKDSRPVGIMMGRLIASIFDQQTAILFQDLLYVSEPCRGAAHLLLAEFIDFGKSNANHVFTTLGQKTNIKGRSLEKFGFKKVEETYLLEIPR